MRVHGGHAGARRHPALACLDFQAGARRHALVFMRVHGGIPSWHVLVFTRVHSEASRPGHPSRSRHLSPGHLKAARDEEARDVRPW